MNEQALLGLADDELVLGWRDSEWTGIAPLLEEDVAFSSIAQNEIGHARAVYGLLVGPEGDQLPGGLEADQTAKGPRHADRTGAVGPVTHRAQAGRTPAARLRIGPRAQ